MQRRKFALITAGVAAGLFLPSIYCSQADLLAGKKMPEPDELSRIMESDTISGIGNAYRKMKTEESGLERLKQVLLTDTSGKMIKPAITQEQLQSLLMDKVKRDFEEGNIIQVDGWILSVTEARQCAYYSLVHS